MPQNRWRAVGEGVTDARDRKFLDWLRDQPCAVTGWDFKPCDPAHIFKTFFGGGVALKSTKAVPLFHEEHVKQHGMPEIQYWRQAVVGNPLLLMRLRALFRDNNHEEYTELELARGKFPIVAYWMDVVRDDVYLKRMIGYLADDYVKRYEIEKGIRKQV